MKRYCSVLGLSEEGMAEYRALHAAVWPEVLARIIERNIRSYTIFLKEPENLLFSVFEYHGTHCAADMAKLAADPARQRWWAINMPRQRPLETRKDCGWWADMTEIFHHD